MEKRLSKRDFLKVSSVAIGGAVLAGCAPASSNAATTVGGRVDPTKLPAKWDIETDVLIIGGGAVGLPASIRVKDTNASLDVLVVDCNYDLGGHAILSGGNIPLAGTSKQKKDGINDSSDLHFKDVTDWSVINANGAAVYRYNDRDVYRIISDNMPATFDFLLENGVKIAEQPIDNRGASGTGISAMREAHTIWTDGPSMESPSAGGGTNLCRGLERSARAKGVKFLLNYHMDTIFREDYQKGKVVGIEAHYTPTDDGKGGAMLPYITDGNLVYSQPTITIRARKSIIVATGGSSSNVDLRRIADPRLTEEIAGSCSEFSPQDGSGELAIMAIGGTMWGIANQSLERNSQLLASNCVGVRHNYPNVRWNNQSPLAHKLKYFGVNMRDWQNAIMVNQVGKRYYNELAGFQADNAGSFGFYGDKGYTHGDWRNAQKRGFKPIDYAGAALALNEGSTAANGWAAGPQWAIFDQDGVERQRFDVTSPDVMDPQYFFKADTLEELAQKINTNPHQKYKMNGAVLKATVERYNSFVGGTDTDFDKPSPKFKIEKAPFYAAWNTIQLHDTYMGVRISGHCHVLTLAGEEIPGLYAGGESTGGANAHGLGRCLTQGYIVGYEAAK